MGRELERNHKSKVAINALARTLALSSNSTQGPSYVVSSSEVRLRYKIQHHVVVPSDRTWELETNLEGVMEACIPRTKVI